MNIISVSMKYTGIYATALGIMGPQGGTGPQGDVGQTGAQGGAGQTGAQGQSGSGILSTIALNPGSTVNIDWSLSKHFTYAASQNTIFTYTNAVNGDEIYVEWTNDGTGGYSMTLPSGTVDIPGTGLVPAQGSCPVIRRLAEHGRLMAFFVGGRPWRVAIRTGNGTGNRCSRSGTSRIKRFPHFAINDDLSKPTFTYWQRKLGFGRRSSRDPRRRRSCR